MSEFHVPPNLLRQLRQEEGFKNEDDIYEMDTYEDVRGLIGEFNPKKEKFIAGELNEKENGLLDEIDSFCDQATMEFRLEFEQLLEDYESKYGKISPEIINYLKQKDLTVPVFKIFDDRNFDQELKRMKLSWEKKFADSFLLVFDFPAPVSKFWWKGEGMEYKKYKDRYNLGEGMVNWRYFYINLVRVIWNKRDSWGDKEGEIMKFHRINYEGEHSPLNYYYAWEVY